MSFSLSSISKGRARKAPRIVLLGVEGVGKSTFAAQSESPVLIPMKGEQGVDEIDVSKTPKVSSYNELMEVISALYQDEHDYKTVVLDSASALEPLIWDEACARNGNVDSIEKIGGGYGKGYTEAAKVWRELTEGLDALREDRGMSSILIGHVITADFNDPETDPYTTYTFDVHKKAAAWLYRWADAILFANFKRAMVQKTEQGFKKETRRGVGSGQRYLYTEKRPAHPGKNRYGLPYEMALDFAQFKAAVDASGTTNEQAATKTSTRK